jgi:hypothetical protein
MELRRRSLSIIATAAGCKRDFGEGGDCAAPKVWDQLNSLGREKRLHLFNQVGARYLVQGPAPSQHFVDRNSME